MPGCPSFWLLFLGQARKSDAREGAQPKRKLTATIGVTLGLLLLTSHAHAFDLDQLSAQLAKPAVVRGSLIQEKHLRALPMPLTSRGQFVLSRDLGLLWQLQSPLEQDYRIDSQGIAKRTPDGWQQQPGQDVAAQQSRLFLAVLKGDHSGLARDFELQLSGSSDAWQLSLTPHSLLLKQIFERIQIEGGALVKRIELRETQGDKTVLRLPDSQPGDALSEQERRDFAD
ncbi:outer membrane lipoprotein carrier protein LolA [Pseudomonas borbori]